jgi:glycerophosphoryl diester phosphodiesterase
MQDMAAFIRPTAHRGLHDAAVGRLENTASAFTAAIARGYGIECDVRPALDGAPVVFHDTTTARLMEDARSLEQLSPSDLKTLRYKGLDERILPLGDALDLVRGEVPLLIEIKSEWQPPDTRFLQNIAKLTAAYKGPVALMSFDPQVMAICRELAPDVPRGIVSGVYRRDGGWWAEQIPAERAERLTNLLESAPAAPDFFAYHVGDLPTPVTRFVREVLGLPIFTWTVRSEADRRIATEWADAPIFEGYLA